MNHKINDGVEAARSTGQRVLERMETAVGSAADEVRKEAHEARERLTHQAEKVGDRVSGKKAKRERKRGRIRRVAASVAGVLGVLSVVVSMRGKLKKSDDKK